MKIITLALFLCVLLALQSSQSQELRKLTRGRAYGKELVQSVSERGKAIVFYDFGVSKAPGGRFLEPVTVKKEIFQKAPQWDGSTPLPRPIRELIKIARGRTGKAQHFKEFKIIACHPDPAKKLVVVTFNSESAANEAPREFDRNVYLLLDGTVLESETTTIGEDEVASLFGYTLPRSAQQSGEVNWWPEK